jgi:hypothetical protein
MQREKGFVELVYQIRDTIDGFKESPEPARAD